VRLTELTAKPQIVPALGLPDGHIIKAADIYRLYFHGPAYQVLEQAWLDGDRILGQMAERLPSNHFPPEKPTLMAPRLIELCLQTAGLWEMTALGRLGLPQYIRQVSLLRTPDPAAGALYAAVTSRPEQGSFDAEVVDAAGNRYMQLVGYRTVAVSDVVDTKSWKEEQAVSV
jgi:hypothetical protein